MEQEALFPVSARQIQTEIVETVDGRDLHGFLEVKTPYTMWIERALLSAQRVEDKDYIVFNKSVKNPDGGRPTKEYYLTLECCEHLGMMSDRAKGVQIREYFIGIKNAYIQKLQADQEARAHEPWFQRLLNSTPADYEPKFAGELAAQLNALNEKTRQGIPKLPTDRGSTRVAGIVPNRIRQGYIGTLGADGYLEAQRRAREAGAEATHQMLQDMPLDMMRGLMLGLAVAARSEQHYEDMFEAATRNEQLCMRFRWPEIGESGAAKKGSD